MAESAERTLRAHLPMLARLAAAHEANPALREELLQEMTLAAWQALPRWRGDGELKAYLARVGHNCAVNHVVRHSRQLSTVPLIENDPWAPQPRDPEPEPAAALEVAEQQVQLLKAIQKLPVGLRAALVLALEGLPHRDIATTLGLSIGNVDVRLSRARAALRKLMNTEDAHDAN